MYRPLSATSELGSTLGTPGTGLGGGALATPGGVGMALPRPDGVEAPGAAAGGFQMTGYQKQQLLIPEQVRGDTDSCRHS